MNKPALKLFGFFNFDTVNRLAQMRHAQLRRIGSSPRQDAFPNAGIKARFGQCVSCHGSALPRRDQI